MMNSTPPRGGAPEPESDEEPVERKPTNPWLHGSLYVLGAYMVTLMGQPIFVYLWLRGEVGEMRALKLLEQPEQLATVIEELPLLELLQIVVAGQGLALIYTFILWRALREGGFKELGLPEGLTGPKGIAMGAAQGILLIGCVVTLGVLIGDLRIGGWSASPDLLRDGALAGLFAASLFLISAFAEEVLFRGYLFRILLESGNILGAILATTLFFGAFHGYNPGAGFIGVVGTGLAGALFALMVLRDGHLWRAVGVHFGWNFAMGHLASLPVSGLTVVGLVQWSEASTMDSVWIGGEFGPEGGIVGIVVLGAAVAWLARDLNRHGMRHPPKPHPKPVTDDLDQAGAGRP